MTTRDVTYASDVSEAIKADNFEAFQNIIKAAQQEFSESEFAKWISMHVLMCTFLFDNREKFFYYVLDLPSFDVNYISRAGYNCLVHLLWAPLRETFTMELIKRGDNLHIRDRHGDTLIHIAIFSMASSTKGTKLVDFFIKQGIDVNSQNNSGETPLYRACDLDYRWAYLLLFYNANPKIPTYRGILPLAALALYDNHEEIVVLKNILFNYTFEAKKSTVGLLSLGLFMRFSVEFFSKICEKVSAITYDISHVKEFFQYIRKAHPINIRMFIKKYGVVVKDLINQQLLLTNILESCLGVDVYGDSCLFEVNKILEPFLYSDYITEMVQNHNPTYPTVASLIKCYNLNAYTSNFAKEQKIIKMVCLLLEQGLTITITDLDTVYKYFGYGKFLKILLHMDFIDNSKESALEDYFPIGKYLAENSGRDRDRLELSGMVQLLSQPAIDIGNCLADPLSFPDMLRFFNNQKLKKMCLEKSNDDRVLEKVKTMPDVPLLIELSRNASRKFIVDKFQIKKCNKFYAVLKCLPISNKYRRIIALEDELY